MKRPCSACGCKTQQAAITDGEGVKFWWCENCRNVTPRKTRQSTRVKELAQLFERLAK